jgi:uncharacterized protein
MINREHYYNKIIDGFGHNPIVVLIGARQVGKTSLMEIFVKDKEHLWLNGQDPEIAQIFQKLSTLEQYLKININDDVKGLLVIDEFQFINNISLQLKLLVDKYKNLKILCSGSSSLHIVQKVEESLAGRIRLISVYSLNFYEYIKFKNEELYRKIEKLEIGDDSDVLFPMLQVILNEYLTYGGLPKIALASDYNEKKELLNDIYQTYLLKDIRQYINNIDFIAFNKLLRLLSSQISNLVNINEISNTIQLSYRKCEEYVNILEQMFIIHLVNPFSSNYRKEITKMKKIYFCDIGLRNVIYNSFNDIDVRVDNGAIFENYVFLQLLRNHKLASINYYRTKDNTEIDFIVNNNKEIVALEVKFKHFKKHKKIRSLSEFGKKHNVYISYIVNKNLIESAGNQYYIQPYHIVKI